MKKIGLFILSLCISVASMAQTDKKMLSKMQKEFPQLGVTDVIFLPEVKLYEVKAKTSNLLSYTNENMDFFLINGEIFNPKTQRNVSKERDFAYAKNFFNTLPFEKAIKVTYGKGTRKVAIFSDPDCPFCKQTDIEIHTKLVKQDLTVYYFMNPLNIPGHEQAPLKAAKVWCAPDRAKAWKDWMLEGKLPNNNGTCKNPVAETKALAQEAGFNSTPIMIFDNGMVYNGAVSAEEFMKILNMRI